MPPISPERAAALQAEWRRIAAVAFGREIQRRLEERIATGDDPLPVLFVSHSETPEHLMGTAAKRAGLPEESG